MSKGTSRLRLRRASVITTLAAATLILLPGTVMAETITGGPGDDLLIGTSDPDTIYGRRGDDRIYGRGGGDTLRGNRGGDRIFGESGADTLYGGRGRDTLVGGPGEDMFFGGRGADVIRASGDGSVDEVNCGVGDDVAFVDATDVVNADCETVYVLAEGPPAP